MNLIDDIIIIKNPEILVEKFDSIDPEYDCVFCIPEKSKIQLTFGFSGEIHVSLGEPINLSLYKTKFQENSPIRNWRNKIDLKFCMPTGITPIFKKSNTRFFLGNNTNYKDYLSVQVGDGKVLRQTEWRYSIIYQNLEVETTFNRDLLMQDAPNFILKEDQILFDILPVKTIFSRCENIGQIYLIKNTEFYLNFKEAI